MAIRSINSKYFRHRLFPRVRHRRKLSGFLNAAVTALAASASAQTVTPKRTTNTFAEALVVFAGNLANADTLTIGNFPYTFVTALTEAKATGTLTNDGVNVTALDTVTIDGTVYTFKAALTEAKATGTLTNDGTNVTAADTVTIDGRVYTFKAALTEVKATGTLTNTTVQPSNGDTVTIGANVYTFQTSLTNVAGNIKIAATAALSMTNLFNGINATGGVSGTDYAAANVAHPTVTATNPTATTVVLTAKTPGVAGNSIATTETSAVLSFGGATLSGGVDPVLNEVKVGAANTNSMTSLFEAINAGANAGTDYATGTVIHPTVSATNPTGTTVVLTAKTPGTAGNALATTETSTHLSFGGATLVGGVQPVLNEVKVGAANTNSMTSLFEAINAGANAGIDYATGTVAHATVSATNPTGTTVVLTAKSVGVAGNSIATTEASTHLSFGAATLAGGVAAVANQVVIQGTAAGTRDKLVLAITAGAGLGTDYSTGTVVHDKVGAAASGADLLLTGLVAGSTGWGVRLSKSAANLTLPGKPITDGPLWTATGHPFVEGAGPVRLTNSGGALPTGALAARDLWVHVVDANTIALATSPEAMRKGIYMQTTSAGSGTHSVTRSVTAQGFFGMLGANKPRTVATASDVDNLK